MDLRGIFVALTTPFEGGTVALDLVRHNVASYNAAPLAGYLALGSTGEFPHLSQEERRQVLEAVVEEAAAAGRPVIAGVGELSTAAAAAAAREAARAGAAAVLVVPPFYYRPAMGDDALAAHYTRVAEASPVPVLLYNIPSLAGVSLSPGLVARLALHPNIAGIKDSSGDPSLLRAYLEGAAAAAGAGSDFAVLTSSGSGLVAALQAGARGAVLGVAAAAPWECAEIAAALARGDVKQALRLQERVAALERRVVEAHGLAGLKWALDLIGYFGLEPRPPLRPLGEEAKAEVRGALWELGWLNFC